MAAASPVFKAMLSPRFKEGSEPSSTGAVEVACPEDDGQAMTVICYIAHHKPSQVKHPRDLYVPDIVKMARLSEKYGFNEMMRPHSKCWLTYKMEDPGILPGAGERDQEFRKIGEPCEWLPAAAYYFELPETFVRAGRNIITECAPIKGKMKRKKTLNVAVAVDEKVMEVLRTLPRGALVVANVLTVTIGALSEERARLLHLSCAAIEDEVRPEDLKGPFHGCGCGWSKKRVWRVIDQFIQRRIWPMTPLQDDSLTDIWDRMEDDGFTWKDDVPCGPTCTSHDSGNIYYVEQALTLALRPIRDGMKVPCYQCAHSDAMFELEVCEHESLQE